MPSTAPVGWVFLDRRREDGYTIRWQRGASVAYVLAGVVRNEIESWTPLAAS